MAEPICRICKSNPAHSDEHLISSALGGRTKVPGVLCKQCNETCGAGIDKVLAEKFAAIRNMLGIVGDRRQTASLTVTDEAGRRLYIGPGMIVRGAAGPPDVRINADGTFEGTFLSEKAAREYIDSLKRKHPGKPIDVSSAEAACVFPGQVPMTLQLGGHDVMRSCVKSALTLIIHAGKPEAGLDAAWNYVATGAEPERVNVYFTAAPPPWTPESDFGQVPHLVAVVASKSSRTVAMQVRLFGDIAIAGTLAVDADVDDWRVACAMDPQRGTYELTDSFEGKPEDGAQTADEVIASITAAVARIRKVGQGVTADALANEITTRLVNKHLGPLREGDFITEEIFAALAKDVAEEAARHRFRIDSSEPDEEMRQRMDQHAKKT